MEQESRESKYTSNVLPCMIDTLQLSAFCFVSFSVVSVEQERVSAGMSCMALDDVSAAVGDGEGDDAAKLETGD